jgi:putative ABC transport system permease protein
MHGETLPEEYVHRISMSQIQGVDNLSPKLCMSTPLDGKSITLTGILPKSEFQAKAAWAGAGIFARPIGCGADEANAAPDPKKLAKKRVIETLEENQVLVGADLAARHKLNEGDSLTLAGETFSVLALLPETGTIDDGRIFAHLHTVQRLAKQGEVVGVIEVVGCCKQIASGMVESLNKLLPEARVVTITHLARTQQNVNQMMERLSMVFLVVLLLVGGAAMAAAFYANVRERTREIGTWMALGATPDFILRLIVGKAIVLGLVGGVLGYILGSGAAWWLGPMLANVEVRPLPLMALPALGLAVAVTMLSSVWPAYRAAQLDPSVAFREV